jgi:hypothetical protein
MGVPGTGDATGFDTRARGVHDTTGPVSRMSCVGLHIVPGAGDPSARYPPDGYGSAARLVAGKLLQSLMTAFMQN